LDAFEGEGFEMSLAIAIDLNQGLAIIARSGVVTGCDLGLEVGGEVFGEGDGEGVHGGLEDEGVILWWWVLGWSFVVSIDILEDFNFGGVGKMILGFIALNFIASNIVTSDICDHVAWWVGLLTSQRLTENIVVVKSAPSLNSKNYSSDFIVFWTWEFLIARQDFIVRVASPFWRIAIFNVSSG
jgi:hypothetical protein